MKCFMASLLLFIFLICQRSLRCMKWIGVCRNMKPCPSSWNFTSKELKIECSNLLTAIEVTGASRWVIMSSSSCNPTNNIKWLSGSTISCLPNFLGLFRYWTELAQLHTSLNCHLRLPFTMFSMYPSLRSASIHLLLHTSLFLMVTPSLVPPRFQKQSLTTKWWKKLVR